MTPEPTPAFSAPVVDLLLQTLEIEQLEVLLYDSALESATKGELRDEWQRNLSQTQEHVRSVRALMPSRFATAGRLPLSARSASRMTSRSVAQRE